METFQFVLLRSRGFDNVGTLHANFNERGPMSSVTQRKSFCVLGTPPMSQKSDITSEVSPAFQKRARRRRSAPRKQGLLQVRRVRLDLGGGWGCYSVAPTCLPRLGDTPRTAWIVACCQLAGNDDPETQRQGNADPCSQAGSARWCSTQGRELVLSGQDTLLAKMITS